MVKMFLQYDIKPILVFDGADLPAKESTNTGRSTYGLCCSSEYIVIEKRHRRRARNFTLRDDTRRRMTASNEL